MHEYLIHLQSVYEPHLSQNLSATARQTRWCVQNTRRNNIPILSGNATFEIYEQIQASWILLSLILEVKFLLFLVLFVCLSFLAYIYTIPALHICVCVHHKITMIIHCQVTTGLVYKWLIYRNNFEQWHHSLDPDNSANVHCDQNLCMNVGG